MNTGKLFMTAAALLVGAAAMPPPPLLAASCCGGGSAAALLVPAYATAVADLSLELEKYAGYWNQQGKHLDDPPGSDLRQYRLNLGYGMRFTDNWQGSVILPYVWNDNSYSGVDSRSAGLGDTTLALWYEARHDQAIWKPQSAGDLLPALTAGVGLLIPSGISPYDDKGSSFDVTGRGFYRLDANLLVEKTVQPFNVSLALAYGSHFQRAVNRDYGKDVEPYRKRLGDRASAALALGYTQVIGTGGDSLTGTLSYAWLHEDDCRYNGVRDPGSGFAKQSAGAALSYANLDSDWSLRASWNHAISANGWGRNFPTTDIVTLGVRYVFR
jgi:hypothetical protein